MGSTLTLTRIMLVLNTNVSTLFEQNRKHTSEVLYMVYRSSFSLLRKLRVKTNLQTVAATFSTVAS